MRKKKILSRFVKTDRGKGEKRGKDGLSRRKKERKRRNRNYVS